MAADHRGPPPQRPHSSPLHPKSAPATLAGILVPTLGSRGDRTELRSVLFICSFNLLRVFTSLFREGRRHALSLFCPSVHPSVPGRAGSGAEGRHLDRAAGGHGWVQRREATVNFKEFLQDIFINFFFLVVFGTGGGVAREGDLCFRFLLLVLSTHTDINRSLYSEPAGTVPLPAPVRAWGHQPTAGAG